MLEIKWPALGELSKLNEIFVEHMLQAYGIITY